MCNFLVTDIERFKKFRKTPFADTMASIIPKSSIRFDSTSIGFFTSTLLAWYSIIMSPVFLCRYYIRTCVCRKSNLQSHYSTKNFFGVRGRFFRCPENEEGDNNDNNGQTCFIKPTDMGFSVSLPTNRQCSLASSIVCMVVPSRFVAFTMWADHVVFMAALYSRHNSPL